MLFVVATSNSNVLHFLLALECWENFRKSLGIEITSLGGDGCEYGFFKSEDILFLFF